VESASVLAERHSKATKQTNKHLTPFRNDIVTESNVFTQEESSEALAAFLYKTSQTLVWQDAQAPAQVQA
jgi:hypothetical protein